MLKSVIIVQMESINAIEILFCKTMNNITISWNNIYIFFSCIIIFAKAYGILWT